MESDRGKQYSLDQSMFERLVREDNCLSPAQLDVQRRMRPEISELIRQTIYPDHRHEEDSPEEGTKSKSNGWEVEMVCSLVRHLVRQGKYRSNDIAILTPYTGQLQKLRRHLSGTFEVVISDRDQEALERDGLHLEPVTLQGEFKAAKKVGLDKLLRVATVDNFQGEEAEVVIISLVRSNEQGKVGFLKTKNRINVLLSRAKQGMYIIGNAETAATVPMWNDVCEILQKRDSMGLKLPLSCPRHPEKAILVEEPEDFLRFAPEGGCDLTCDKLQAVCQHPCPKICSDPCGKCLVPVDDVPCYQARFPERIKCPRKVLKTVPDCGHNVEAFCGTDTSDPRFLCPTPCLEQLYCGHQCGGTCGTCFALDDADDEHELVARTIAHQPCGNICGRGFTTCSHMCTKRCHEGTECGVCQAPCEVKCGHTKCPKVCSDSCAPCAELCKWTCEHEGRCPLPCAAPCERLPCGERCNRQLSCGHQCPTVCGEICPGQEYCQICCKDDKREQEVDLLEFNTYGSVNLDTDPILILGCGHFFTRETMNLHIRLDKVYCGDQDGYFNGITYPSGDLEQPFPSCPKCRQPLRQYSVRRYGRVINMAILEQMTKRYISSSASKYTSMVSEVATIETGFRDSMDRFLRELLSPSASQKKMREDIEQRISSLRRTSDLQQPAQKLYEITVSQKKRISDNTSPITALYIGLDKRSHILAKLLKAQVDLVKTMEWFLILNNIKKPSATLGNLSVTIDWLTGLIKTSMPEAINNCSEAIREACEQSFWAFEIEGHTYLAGLVAIWRQLPPTPDSQKGLDQAFDDAKAGLQKSAQLCTEGKFRNIRTLKKMVEAAEKRLQEDSFYQAVTHEELGRVVETMTGEFTTQGHWYRCANDHPFAIGECGLPMEEALCPECGANFKGYHHQLVAGVKAEEWA
ncbi:AAA domain-containing protein [Trichophaea hybrida]|nr:AAA domain-containing protein [Trichophaea hybrida]